MRFERIDGKDELIVSPLDKVEEPASLVALRTAIAGRLPRVDLPEILLEIAARTDFAGEQGSEAQPGRPARRRGRGVRGDLDGAGQAVMPAGRRDADPDEGGDGSGPRSPCRTLPLVEGDAKAVTVDEPTSAEWVIGEWVTLDRELHPFEALELATVIEAVKLNVLHGWPRWWAWTFASLVAQIAIGILEAAAGELVIVDHVDHDVGETIH